MQALISIEVLTQICGEINASEVTGSRLGDPAFCYWLHSR